MKEDILITIAPIMSDPWTLVIYRDNGEEIVVKINKESKSLATSKRLTIEEVNFIKENYL